MSLIETNPCVPSPCGPNSVCRNTGSVPSCACLPNYIGSPPNCRPECTINAECTSNLACIREKCQDPCPGSCGIDAICNVLNHIPICTCPEGYSGDPFRYCNAQPIQRKIHVIEKERSFNSIILATAPAVYNPCVPNPCGANSKCDDGICSCLPEYQGNPYEGCRPECILSNDCSSDKACIRNKCIDPCPGICGQGADCAVLNHIPICSCPTGYKGNAFVACQIEKGLVVHMFRIRQSISTISASKPLNPCIPSPCGPNSQCREFNSQAVCSCSQGFSGSPPSCRPECVTSAECPLNQACISQKCTDPCLGSCGINSLCQTINHNPICSCPAQFTGDPFVRCTNIRKLSATIFWCVPNNFLSQRQSWKQNQLTHVIHLLVV